MNGINCIKNTELTMHISEAQQRVEWHGKSANPRSHVAPQATLDSGPDVPGSAQYRNAHDEICQRLSVLTKKITQPLPKAAMLSPLLVNGNQPTMLDEHSGKDLMPLIEATIFVATGGLSSIPTFLAITGWKRLGKELTGSVLNLFSPNKKTDLARAANEAKPLSLMTEKAVLETVHSLEALSTQIGHKGAKQLEGIETLLTQYKNLGESLPAGSRFVQDVSRYIESMADLEADRRKAYSLLSAVSQSRASAPDALDYGRQVLQQVDNSEYNSRIFLTEAIKMAKSVLDKLPKEHLDNLPRDTIEILRQAISRLPPSP